MIDSYVVQFKYADAALQETIKTLKTGEDWKLFFLDLSPLLGCAFLSFRRKKVYRGPMVFCAVVAMYMMQRLTYYSHYYIIYVPFVPIAIGWLFSKEVSKTTSLRRQTIYAAATTAVVLIVLLESIQVGRDQYLLIDFYNNLKVPGEYELTLKEQGDLIPAEDRDQAIAYNHRSNWYLINDITPCYRFFYAQDMFWNYSQVAAQEMVDFYQSHGAKWIAVNGDIQNSEIKEAVEQYYDLVDSRYIYENGAWAKLYALKSEYA